MKDLIILAADKAQQALLDGLLPQVARKERWPMPTYDCKVHQHHDSGVLREAHNFLRIYKRTHRHALVLFDYEGCGSEAVQTRELIEQRVTNNLLTTGWAADCCAVIVVAPEIESWLWVAETHIQEVISWRATTGSVYQWLGERGFQFLPPDTQKPLRPKEAFDAVLQHADQPYSSTFFKQIAARASYKRCHDPAFVKLLTHLRQWFAVTQ